GHRGAATPSQTGPFSKGFAGSAAPGNPNASLTDALPGDLPSATRPGREVPVHGVPAPAVTVTVAAGGNPPVIGPAASFSTNGGSVVVVCDTYGPRVTRVVAKPGYYPNQASLIFATFVFFTK